VAAVTAEPTSVPEVGATRVYVDRDAAYAYEAIQDGVAVVRNGRAQIRPD
jgi:hypothetical protein